MHFLKSATQFVLVLFASVLSISLLYIVFMNPNDQTVVSGLKDLFGNASLMTMAFYFGQKGLPTGGTIDQPINTSSTTQNTLKSTEPVTPAPND